ncbi:Fur-regulated basic protein FbpA [Bacillus sp. Bva_UNVM-123]|uniref:Fur-regulated basic protein FbpA n=1 Tax=Bacillus sp. Bva_UNVM-123 TaxID=2829798 RepID=UPI00391F145A
MKLFKTYLREAQERLKDSLIERLLALGVTKVNDGRQLYELTLTELTNEYDYAKKRCKTCSI